MDSPRAKSDRLHACRDKWQLTATSSNVTAGMELNFRFIKHQSWIKINVEKALLLKTD